MQGRGGFGRPGQAAGWIVLAADPARHPPLSVRLPQLLRRRGPCLVRHLTQLAAALTSHFRLRQRPSARSARIAGEPMRTYTIREAAEVTTKSHAALRSMVDRGQLRSVGGGRGSPRRIPHSELARAAILRDQVEASAIAELADRLARVERELAEHRQLSEQVSREREELARERDQLSDQLAAAEARAAEDAEWRRELAGAGFWERRRMLREARAGEGASV